MTANDNTQKDDATTTEEPRAGGHSDSGFQQLGGETAEDPGATDTGIGGTGGVDGATLGGLGREEAPHIVPPASDEG
jgi:hypothetical protein